MTSQLSIVLFILALIQASIAQRCGDNGLIMPNNTCSCPAFVPQLNPTSPCLSGTCLNTGTADPITKKCTCPPGYFAGHCEPRGCRPSVKSNLDNTKRSLIFSFSAKSSMQSLNNIVLDNLEALATSLGNATTNYVVFASVSTAGFIQNMNQESTNIKDVISFMRRISYTDTDFPQPYFQQATNAQAYSNVGFSTVIAITDSPPGDADAVENQFIDQGTLEQTLIKTVLQWRNKITFLYVTPLPLTSPDYSTPGFAALQRVAQITHGEVLIVDSINAINSIQQVMTTLLSKFINPENIYVSYGTNQAAATTPSLSTDLNNKLSYLLVTLIPISKGWDPASISVAQNGILPVKYSNGPNYALYALQSNQPVTIHADPSVRFNVRVFQSTLDTVIVSYAPDKVTDGGSALQYSDIQMFMRALPIMQPYYSTITQTVMDPGATTTLSQPLSPYLRDSYQGCTFPYSFDPRSACTPGPYQQVLRFFSGEQQIIFQRVLPGYCGISNYQTGPYVPSRSMMIQNAIVSQDDNEICTSYNYNAQRDNRLSLFNHIAVIIERTSDFNSYILDILAAVTRVKYEAGTLYSLIIYQDGGANIMISTYNYFEYQDMANQLLNVPAFGQERNDKDTALANAIDKAIGISIASPTLIHVFVSYMANFRSSRPMPKDVQVNFFIPSINGYNVRNPDIISVAKQTNGRCMFMAFTELSGLIIPIPNMAPNNQVIMDGIRADCSAGVSYTFNVENFAQSLELIIEGSNTTLLVRDASNQIVPMITTFAGATLQMYTLNPSVQTSGAWTLSITTPTYMCSVQVRTSSYLVPLVGFTSNPNNDVPNTQALMSPATTTLQRPVTNVVFYLAQIGNIASPSAPTVYNMIPSGWTGQDKTDEPVNILVSPRNPQTCAYLYMGKAILPTTTLMKLVFYGKDGKGTTFQRTNYYYQTVDNATAICNNGQMNDSGECVCLPQYSGEFCQDRICQNGGTPSLGTCYCNSGYSGDFCQSIHLNPNGTTTNPPLGSSQTTTSPGNNPITTSSASFYNILSSFAILMLALLL